MVITHLHHQVFGTEEYDLYNNVVCNSHADWDRYPSPGILDPNELREFHVLFAGGVIEVSLAGEELFIRHTMGCSHDINYIGITSGYGADAD